MADENVQFSRGNQRQHIMGRRAVLSAIATATLAACTNQPPAGQKSNPVSNSATRKQIDAFDQAFGALTAGGHLGPTTNNDNGDLAWGQAYLCQALLRAFESTLNTKYLDDFVRRADWMVAQTDKARGVTDFQRRSGPVWRSNANTAALAPLMSATGYRVLDVRYAGKDSDRAYVIVTAGSTPETFTIELGHPTAGTVKLTNVSTDAEDSRFVQNLVLREVYRPDAPWTAAVASEGVPTPGRKELHALYQVGGVDTGMIAYPLARYARIVRQHADLSRTSHRVSATRFLEAAKQAVAFHDDEWSDDGEIAAGYAAPKGSPIPGDGSQLPFNQSHAIGQALCEIWRLTKASTYGDRVHGLVRSWRSALRPGQDGGVLWNHWPPFSHIFRGYSASDSVSVYTPEWSGSRQWEDLSHGAITAEFIAAAHSAGLAATPDDVQALVSAYLKELRLGSDAIRVRFRGPRATPAEAAQSARWLGLANKTIASQVRIVMPSDPSAALGSIVLGRAYLAWAASRKL